MLRLPSFRLEKPHTVAEVLRLLAEHGPSARLLAGGTDLLPNLKHRLAEPEVLIALSAVAELRGIREDPDGGLRIGPMTTLSEVAAAPLIRDRLPALAQAAALVSSPQLRNMGTLGGNVMLDTRCQWINQSHFWRAALGYCLKKDGSKCHVIEGGRKCVAAASNDTAPALMSLDATLCFQGPKGTRELPIQDFWRPDGIWNKRCAPEELLVEIQVPSPPEGHRGAYGKLRDRGSIDFPLLGMAARLDLDPEGCVTHAALCVVALQARPMELRGITEALVGRPVGGPSFDEGVEFAAQAAARQCHPLPNIPGDPEYRQTMVPVLARRSLRAAAAGTAAAPL